MTIIELSAEEDNQVNVKHSDPNLRKTPRAAVDISYNTYLLPAKKPPGRTLRLTRRVRHSLLIVGRRYVPQVENSRYFGASRLPIAEVGGTSRRSREVPGFFEMIAHANEAGSIVYDRKSICSSDVENHFVENPEGSGLSIILRELFGFVWRRVAQANEAGSIVYDRKFRGAKQDCAECNSALRKRRRTELHSVLLVGRSRSHGCFFSDSGCKNTL